MNWEELSFPAQLGIVAGLGVVLIVAFFFIYVQSTQDQIEVLKRQIRELNDSIEEGKRTAARLNEFKQEVRKLEDRFTMFKEIIPEKIEYEVLLKYFSTIASETSVSVRSMAPLPQRPMGFYAEYPIQIKMIGSYHNIIQFYLKIKNLKRIINVYGMLLERRKFEQADQDLDKPISVNFTATTFMFVPEGKRVKPGPGAVGGRRRPAAQGGGAGM
jgi:type IV pilus assembly protein PilO